MWRTLRTWIRRSAFEDEMRDEMRFHLFPAVYSAPSGLHGENLAYATTADNALIIIRRRGDSHSLPMNASFPSVQDPLRAAPAFSAVRIRP